MGESRTTLEQVKDSLAMYGSIMMAVDDESIALGRVAEMMTAYFALTAVDIHNFKFSDNIYVKDTKWRINRISGFDPTGESPTKVELIKILPTPTDCAYVPTGSNTDGSIIFEDAGGTTSDGNQECCEFYGYEWDAGKSKCFNPSLNQATPVAINPLNISPMNQVQNVQMPMKILMK